MATEPMRGSCQPRDEVELTSEATALSGFKTGSQKSFFALWNMEYAAAACMYMHATVIRWVLAAAVRIVGCDGIHRDPSERRERIVRNLIILYSLV